MKKVILFSIIALCVMVGISFGQAEISSSVNIISGNMNETSNFSSVISTDNNTFIGDRYQSDFHGIQLYNTTYDHTFIDGDAQTKITGGSTFGVPGMRFTEKIGTEQVDVTGKDCCGVAAGSKFSVYGVNEYESAASQGGTGECCGVNYNVDAAEGAGRIAFGYIENKIGEDVIPEELDGDGNVITPETTIFGNSHYKYEIEVNGNHWTNFSGVAVAPPCTPADKPNPPLSGILNLCPWPVDELPTNMPFNVLPSTQTP